MRRKVIHEPTLSDTALLILQTFSEAFIESFWPHPYYHAFCEHDQKHSFRKALDRAVEKGLVSKKRKNGRILFSISKKGQETAKRISLKMAMAKNKRWDGRWRLFIFDVDEKSRAKRDFLRRELLNFDFYPLQKSVFVYPHPLPKEFFELWKGFDFGQQLIVVESAKIREDKHLRDFFWPKQE